MRASDAPRADPHPALMCVRAFGFLFFTDAWNNFDAFVVATALGDFTLTTMGAESGNAHNTAITLLYNAPVTLL